MAEAAARGRPRAPDTAGGAGTGHPPEDTFDELRTLLVGPEQRELRDLREYIHDPTAQTREVSRVLPDAIALRAEDEQLTRALAPTVEEAITSSVRRDPRPLADALFPVIGPAIRKAIAHTLAGMVESLNRTVEHSFSWRALQWRWTALRTGKPFAEIVLLNTLQYRVEQVFLIHAETGLLLQHLSLDPHAHQDADQVSAMLTAIRDFARDSFRVAGGESLEGLRIGDLSVIVEQGPYAILAGVVRGTAPHTLRSLFQDALESVHRQFSPELKSFRGDAAPFERARPILEGCLASQFRPREKTASYRRWGVAGAILLLAIGSWLFLGWRERQRWNAYLQALRTQPGIVVVSSGRRDGRFFVEGLRDPLSRDPAQLVAGTGVSNGSFDAQWQPYQALSPDFVSARARDLLQPPAGVTLQFRDGVLTATGSASDRWIVESERLAPAIAGVRRFQYGGLEPDVRIKQQLEALALTFPKGEAVLADGQNDTIDQIARLLGELNGVSGLRGRRTRVDLVGHADTDGSDEINAPLSVARAETILRQLPLSRFDALELVSRGVGTAEPLAPGVTETEKARNRRVSFRVRLADGTSPPDTHP
jgi:outer membrane protein OmpA-like peptidoglycan-associated protein/type II secretory pathway component PulM